MTIKSDIDILKQAADLNTTYKMKKKKNSSGDGRTGSRNTSPLREIIHMVSKKEKKSEPCSAKHIINYKFVQTVKQ